MKPTNHHIQGLARKLFHHKQGLVRPKLMHPKRDWFVGVLVGVVIIIVMIGWSAYTYLDKRDAIALEDTNIEAEIPVYKAALVEEALTLFEQRKENFAQLNQSSAAVVAPPTESSDAVATSSATTTISTTTTTTTATTTVEREEEVVIDAEPDQAVTPALTPSNLATDNEGSTGTPTLVN